MRHDRFNTGRSPIRGRYHAAHRPWPFKTGKAYVIADVFPLGSRQL